ncbi:MAG: hypothetical protein ABI806_00885 [Candidatus Solibacter sp.]
MILSTTAEQRTRAIRMLRMEASILPLFFSLAIGLGAQPLPGKLETAPSGTAAPNSPKSTDGPELGAAAAKAMAAADRPSVNPLGSLFEVTEAKRKLWEKADAAAAESIKKVGADDPCSKRIPGFTKAALDSFSDYAKAYSLYIEKWSALTQEAIQGLEEQGADGKKPREDLPAELQRINDQIKQAQEDLANYPKDNPTFKEARDATANVVELLLKNKQTLETAIKDSDSEQESHLAQKQLLQARLQEIAAMTQRRDLYKTAAENRYQAWRSEWGSKCLVFLSKVSKGQ